VFSPRHRLRARIVPGYPEPTFDDKGEANAPACPHRIAWAKLLQRVFAIDVLECPRCRGRMQRIAFILEPDAIRKILDCVGHAADSPVAA